MRKTDLIRLLTGGTMTPAQIAALVQRNCLSFTPTARDRADLIGLGADSGVMARIDGCARSRPPTRAAAGPAPRTPSAAPPRDTAPRPPVVPPALSPRPALVAVPLLSRALAQTGGTAVVRVALKRGTQAVAGVRLALRGTARLAGPGAGDAEAVTDENGIAQFRFPAGSTPGTVRLSIASLEGGPLDEPAEVDLTITAPAIPAQPPPPRPSPERTGFVLGTGQRGRVGEVAPLPVVFEVRDSAGAPLGAVAVSLSVVNGSLVGAEPRTDSLGQARAQVVFGERAGVATVVTARVASIERQATLFPTAGVPSRLVVLLDGNALVGQVVVQVGRASELRIFCRDRFGNSVALSGLRAMVGDERVVRVMGVTSDTLGGAVTVQGGRAGSTNLVIQGSGLRADFSALVRP